MMLGLAPVICSAPFQRIGGLEAIIRKMFANGEQGLAYDIDNISTLFQDSAFAAPVTAVEQQVGSMLDLSGRGNHASMVTTPKRPIYSRRVNLLTKTEQFDDAVWSKARCSVTSNAAVGPDGLMSAEKVIADEQSNPHFISATVGFKSGVTCRISVYAKAGEWDNVMIFGQNSIAGRFNLSLGTYVSNVVGLPIAPTITPVGGGWYLLALSYVTTVDSQSTAIRIMPSDGDSSTPGNGVAGLYLWGASMTIATDAHLPYQRVNTDTDYDADPAKFPAYLRWDGVDDAMQTGNIDFTGTDKMTVWAGITKLSDAANGIVYEFGSPESVNSGSFSMWAPINLGAAPLGVTAKGASRSVAATSAFSGVASGVVVQDTSLSAPRNALRLNGATLTTQTTALGGSFGNFPLNIGAREGTSIFFNGRLYSLIVRGAQSSLSQIEATEAYIKQKMRLP